jgi:hypothetical protein
MSYLYGRDKPENPPYLADMMGQEIRRGDLVAYATGRGANAELRIATVVDAAWHEKMSGGYWDFKVRAFLETSYDRNGPGRPVEAARLSTPSRGRMVRLEKGPLW